MLPSPRANKWGAPDSHGQTPEPLLPTPGAYESTPTDDYVAEVREAGVRPDRRLYLPGRKWHAQRTLSRIAPALLPTPTTSDARGPSPQHEGTMAVSTRGLNLRTASSLLPTPTARLGPRGMPGESTARRRMLGEGRRDLEDAVALLPTPTVNDSRCGRNSTARRMADSGHHDGWTLTDVVGVPTSQRFGAGRHFTDPLPDHGTNEDA